MKDKYITRGISKDTGRFVYGNYSVIEGKHYILEEDAISKLFSKCIVIILTQLYKPL